MPSPPPNSSPGAEFMDDFYAECDEHFIEIRRSLLKFEEQVGQVGLDARALETIFRSFHSLKGICGMAGLQTAEKLAHRAEDYLRALMHQETILTPEGLDVLTRVIQKLEDLVISHHHGRPPPEIEGLLGEVSALTQKGERIVPDAPTAAPGPGGYASEVMARMEAARQQGKKLLRCVFRPSPELAQRGVNVSSIRIQLAAVGEILQGVPRVQAGGELHFEFIIAAEAEPADLQRWHSDGAEFIAMAVGEPAGAAPPLPGTASARATPSVAPSHFVRVDLSRLDELMRIMGEMVVQRARLDETIIRVANLLPTRESSKLQEIVHGFTRELRHLRDGLMRVRMVPIGEIFERLPFVVRDLSRETKKKVRLDISGRATEIDKYLVERLKDPLLHLVRNALAHGVEDPEERAASGKNAEGTITLRASTAGETVLIEVGDDGRGISPEKIAERARRMGLEVSEHLEPTELLELLCTPGFSSREEADRGAGRGMGMAAVKSTVLDLGGKIELSSEPGRGSTFRLRLPLTLAVADALIVSAGGQRFAMPQTAVQEIATAAEASISRFEQYELVKYRNGVLPLVRLASVFGLKAESRTEFPVLVIGTGLGAVGILADRVLGHREIVVRSVHDPLLKVPGISGATELGDGQAVLILDSAALTQKAKERQGAAARQSAVFSQSL